MSLEGGVGVFYPGFIIIGHVMLGAWGHAPRNFFEI